MEAKTQFDFTTRREGMKDPGGILQTMQLLDHPVALLCNASGEIRWTAKSFLLKGVAPDPGFEVAALLRMSFPAGERGVECSILPMPWCDLSQDKINTAVRDLVSYFSRERRAESCATK